MPPHYFVGRRNVFIEGLFIVIHPYYSIALHPYYSRSRSCITICEYNFSQICNDYTNSYNIKMRHATHIQSSVSTQICCINRIVQDLLTNITTHVSHTSKLTSRSIILSSYYTLLYLIDRAHLELPMLLKINFGK